MRCKKAPAKFFEDISDQADGLCTRCLIQWAEIRRESQNMQDFFERPCVMDKNEAMGACAFDKLLGKNVPHIIEKIFLPLDYKTIKECFEVGSTFTHLLKTEQFLNVLKLVFKKDIHDDLWGAIGENKVDKVKRILSSGMAEVNCERDIMLPENGRRQRKRKETPILYAVRMDLEDMAQLLIKRGADPNWLWQYKGGMTPLCVASAMGNPSVVRVLLNAGADPNKAGRWGGYTPLHWSYIRNDTEIANILRDAGAYNSRILERYLQHPTTWFDFLRHGGVQGQNRWMVVTDFTPLFLI